MNHAVPPPRETFAQRHPLVVVWLHWITVAVLFAGVAFVLTREEIGARELKRLLLEQHRSLGLLVLALVMPRLVSRLWNRRELVRHVLPWSLNLAATVGHWSLYLLMVATPLLGWALTNAHGQDASLFGWLTLPPLVAPDTDLADTLADWHELSAWSLLGFIAAHAVAALWHHYVRRDGVLRAMLPWTPGAAQPIDPSSQD